MEHKIVDISRFKRDNGFYPEINLLVTIKSFELGQIRSRYLASKKNNAGQRAGSAERREVAKGGIAQLKFQSGKMLQTEVLARLKEPRGIAATDRFLSVSAENEVHVLDKGGSLRSFSNPWFSYIHTVDFLNDEKILVSSSGFDALFEYDLKNLEKTWEWFAWEHGFNKGKDPQTGEDILLSRFEITESMGRTMIISDPSKQKLPTAMRAAFINSVVYDAADSSGILATFFHEGALYRIDKETGKATRLLDGMKNPHGGRRWGKNVMATSTGTGEVFVGKGEEWKRYGFKNLPGKPVELEGSEWLQNSIVIEDQFILTIDSNRTSFVIFDPERELFDLIPYNPDWAIQDLITRRLDENEEEMLKSLDEPSTT